jgi:hypothetical protein
MKTPQADETWGVDSVGTGNEPGAMPKRILPHRYLRNQLESVSATIGAGQKLDRRTVFQLSGFIRVDHSRRPLMGINEYLKDRILRGKWVLHV